MLKRALASARYRVRKKLFGNQRDVFGWAARLQEFQATATDREWKQLMFYHEMIEKILDTPGDIAEFGVATGVSFMSFARTIAIAERGFDRKERRRLYGFDSFEGLPPLTGNDGSPQVREREMREGGFHVPEAYARLFEFVRQDPYCSLHQGWFNETLPRFLEEHPHVSFALVHVDCDLYASTKDVLEGTWSRVSPGGVMVFDELFHPDYPGETVAYREFFEGRQDYSLHRSRAKPDKKFLIKLPVPGGTARRSESERVIASTG